MGLFFLILVKSFWWLLWPLNLALTVWLFPQEYGIQSQYWFKDIRYHHPAYCLLLLYLSVVGPTILAPVCMNRIIPDWQSFRPHTTSDSTFPIIKPCILDTFLVWDTTSLWCKNLIFMLLHRKVWVEQPKSELLY